MNISDDVLEVLRASETEGTTLTLMDDLTRPLYVKVNKVLEAMGARWDRKLKVHVFANDAKQACEDAIVSRKVVDLRADYDFFPTPPQLAKQLVEMANVQPGMLCLEPSAGKGAIAKALAVCLASDVHCVELAEENVRALTAMRFTINAGDFLAMTPEYLGLFDRIVMNPPFSGGADAEHIAHAFTFLRPGGVLVSVASASVTFRTSTRYANVRALADAHGSITPLPDDSFKESGTRVRTVVVKLTLRQRATKRRVTT